MVSFSCDHCQNVFTKPKIERHLHACRTRSVSCIDCGTVFDRHTVRSHKSCITESEKYGPRHIKSDGTFCVTCQLKLNGAVHAKQHYDSKKHRAKLRKEKRYANKQQSQDGTRAKQSDEHEERRDEAMSSAEGPNIRGLKKAIRKVLKKAPNNTLRFNILVSEVADRLDLLSSNRLSQLVKRRVSTSSRFRMLKDDVALTCISEQMKGE